MNDHKPPLQKIHQGILHTESKSKQNNVRAGNTKPRKGKGKKVDSSIYSATHNQTPKQERQLNDWDHHIPFNTNTDC
jgi:hypothetical protein